MNISTNVRAVLKKKKKKIKTLENSCEEVRFLVMLQTETLQLFLEEFWQQFQLSELKDSYIQEHYSKDHHTLQAVIVCVETAQLNG